jgi:TonB family protein
MAWHSSLGVWLEEAWILVLNHLWQSTICLLLAWGLVALLRSAPAKFRLWVWLLAAVKFAVPTVLLMTAIERIGFDPAVYLQGPAPLQRNVVLQATQPIATDPFVAYTATTSIVAQPTLHRDVFCWLSLVWLIGLLVLLGRWFVSRWRLVRMLRGAQQVPWVPLHTQLQELQLRLGIHQDVEVVNVEADVEPGVWRIWKPVVLLPSRVIEQLGDAELESVLLHELAHVAQRDNLWCWLQRMLCAVFWFHPLVWWLHHKLIAERELMCDEKVLRWSSCAETYPDTLWKVAQLQFGWTVTGVSHFTGTNLKRRIKSMLQQNYSSWTRTHKIAAVAMTTVLCVVAFATGMFAPRERMLAKMQSLSLPHSVNLPFENAPELPLVITAAEIQFSEADTARIHRNGVPDYSAGSTPQPFRRMNIYARLTNQSPRRIKGYVLEFGHPQEPRKLHRLFQVTQRNAEKTRLAPSLIEPQASVLFSGFASMSSTGNTEAMKTYLSQFQLKVVGIMFEADQEWYWTAAAPGDSTPQIQTQSFHRPVVLGPDGSVLPIPRDDIPETSPPHNAAPYRDEILTAADVTTRPRILYREKAQYTPEAREANVNGVVVLNAIFGADGTVSAIRVIRGLPLGLDEEAVKAAQKIRFQPATKDGQPVSVRMSIEYSFSTYKN